MALGLMFLMIQSAVAVTLPSTSYAPAQQYGGGSSESSVVFSSGSTISGSFLSLGDGSYGGECTGTTGGVPPVGGTCKGCCDSYYNVETCMGGKIEKLEECSALYQSCMDACMQGPTLPLDGGLSILLALALGSGALRVFRKK